MEQTRKSATTRDAVDAAPGTPADRGILDVTLALHRSPALRFELRERPLPADLDLVLRLAAPSQPLLDDTSQQCNVTPTTLREAARFYLQQVLFEPGTDAYRILGVAPDAPFERIREHHQWLQRWLHPDRGDAGEAAFAARLNWAWQQLRNERQRKAYDVERAQAAAASPGHAGQTAPARAATWTTLPVSPSKRPGRWWRRGALGAAFGSCLVLFVLALTRGGPPPAAPPEADTLAAAPVVSSISTTVLTPPAPATPKPTLQTAPAPALASATPRPPHAVTTSVAAALSGDGKRARSVQRAAPPAPLPVPPTLRVAVALAPLTTPPPDTAVHAANPIPAPPPITLATVQPVSTTNAPAAHAPVSAVPATPAAPEVLLHRVDLARQRARLLVAYFRSAGNAVPGWRHAPAPYNAPLQRAALRQRNGLPDVATFALDKPVWQMRENHIAMDADYRVQRDQSVIERGRFRLRMHWQDHAWQITRVQLEPRG